MSKEIPENIKQKIEEKYPEGSHFWNLDKQDAAYFGYSLAQQEIKLLEEREVLWSNKKAQLEEEIIKYVGIGKALMDAAKEIERLKRLLERVVTREYSEVRQTKKNKEEVWNKFKSENQL